MFSFWFKKASLMHGRLESAGGSSSNTCLSKESSSIWKSSSADCLSSSKVSVRVGTGGSERSPRRLSRSEPSKSARLTKWEV